MKIKVKIRVNGAEKTVEGAALTYAEVSILAYGMERHGLSITYRSPNGGPSGILADGESVELVEGMSFTTAMTGDA